MDLIFSTSGGWAATVARLTVGLIILPHGMQKVLGWYGRDGFNGTIKRFTQDMGYPFIVAFFIIFFEFFGAISLILGFASRFMAFGIIVLMIGAITQVHRHYGYFLNWHSEKAGEGMQFNLLMIGAALVVMILGSGHYAVDSFIKF